MLLIFLSWLYILFTTINLGFGLDKILGLKNKDFVTTAILGLFSATVFASIWAIFGRINIAFHVFLLLLNLIIFFKFKKEISAIYKSFTLQIQQLELPLKLYLGIISILIIAQCASIPYVNDNESYYIQTIKWLNEYGFVKGIINIHLFLGQTSGWHITQSVFNFSFLYKNFNDLSGFCLLLGNIFAIQKLNKFFTNKNLNYLTIGLFPIFNILFFQFISAPSPDIPVYVISFVIIFYFLENFKNVSIENFNLIVILTLFVVYIKNTSVALILIPIIIFVFNYKRLVKKLMIPFTVAMLILVLFITKNMILCGIPIYPSKIFTSLFTDYAVPDVIINNYFHELKYFGYYIDFEQYQKMSAFDLFIKWLSAPKLDGLFNKTSILLVLIVPFFILKFQNKKEIWILYVIMIAQLLFLFGTSPQYRYFMNFVLFFSLFCFCCIIQNKKAIQLLLLITVIPTIIVLFIPINLNQFADNKFMIELSTFSSKNIVYPHSNSKNNTLFETAQEGNFIYNSPLKNDFFWGSGDGDLPCVNKDQIQYYKKYFHVTPQMRTNDLKDGFYAKKIIPNE